MLSRFARVPQPPPRLTANCLPLRSSPRLGTILVAKNEPRPRSRVKLVKPGNPDVNWSLKGDVIGALYSEQHAPCKARYPPHPAMNPFPSLLALESRVGVQCTRRYIEPTLDRGNPVCFPMRPTWWLFPMARTREADHPWKMKISRIYVNAPWISRT